MDENTRMNMHRFMDYSFLIFSWVMTGVILICFCWTYFGDLNPEFFEVNSYLYYICVGVYACERKIKHHLFPQDTPQRINEFIVVIWLAVSIFFAAYTIFGDHAKLELLKELVILDGVLVLILGAGQGLKHVIVHMVKK
ncbi:hypothetical protein HQ571_00500 [Candidatus Kuenenbacteria bacterium]|nr:hypothetical protein [Candidatus Kuenenbacteria bacterium]